MSTLGDGLEILDADVGGIEMDSRIRSVVRRDEVRFEQLNHQEREPEPNQSRHICGPGNEDEQCPHSNLS